MYFLKLVNSSLGDWNLTESRAAWVPQIDSVLVQRPYLAPGITGLGITPVWGLEWGALNIRILDRPLSSTLRKKKCVKL